MKITTKHINRAKNANVYLIATIAAIAGFLFGFDTGVISGAKEFMSASLHFDEFFLGKTMLNGIVVGSVPGGALLGAMMSGFFANRLGRRRSVMFTAILFMAGTLSIALADAVTSVIIGRIILGVAIGISAMVTPMYLSEVAPPKIRGKIIFLFQLAITLGIFSAFGVNYLCASLISNPDMAWRSMFAVAMVPAVVLFFGMRAMPFSPRWLYLIGKIQEAEQTLKFLMGKDNIDEEMKEIGDSVADKLGGGPLLIFQKPFFPLLAIAFALFAFQQLSGINAVIYYGPEIFEKAGFRENAKLLANATMGLVNVLATILGVWLVDRIGRRPLLFWGFTGLVATLFALSFFLSNPAYAKLSLVTVFLYIISFAVSLGGIPYILMSEIFPLKMRSAGMAIASCANWGFNMLISFSFGILVNAMGSMENVFILYGSLTILGFFICYRFMPETKNRPLEEIEFNLLQGKKLRDLGEPVDEDAFDLPTEEEQPSFS